MAARIASPINAGRAGKRRQLFFMKFKFKFLFFWMNVIDFVFQSKCRLAASRSRRCNAVPRSQCTSPRRTTRRTACGPPRSTSACCGRSSSAALTRWCCWSLAASASAEPSCQLGQRDARRDALRGGALHPGASRAAGDLQDVRHQRRHLWTSALAQPRR